MIYMDTDHLNPADYPFAVLDAMRSGTLYFRTDTGRTDYLTDHPHARPVDGSPASHADRFIAR